MNFKIELFLKKLADYKCLRVLCEYYWISHCKGQIICLSNVIKIMQ